MKELSRHLIALVLSLFFAEIVIRAVDIAPSISPLAKGRYRLSNNQKIGYEPIPNLQFDGESRNGYQYRGTSNRLGYRGPSYSTAKPSGIYRIAVLGDSVTEGLGIDQYEELFTAKMEHALREEGTNAQVLNFGVSGYNTQQEVETLKAKGLMFNPDLVLLAYSLNDREGPHHKIIRKIMAEVSDKKQLHALGGLGERYLVKSAIYRLVRFRLLAPSEDEEIVPNRKEYSTGDTVAKYVNELGQLSKLHDFQVLVVVFPRAKDRSFTSYSFHDDHKFIREIAMEQNLLFLDLLPVYIACEIEIQKTLYRDTLHPNRRGNTCAANAITGFILENIIDDTKFRKK